MDHLKLTVDKLSVEAVSDLVVDDSCGAISVFVGTTRDNFEDKKVVKLEYEAYEPMALKAMKSICDEIRSKWTAVHGIAIYHRLGEVPCREASLVVAVSSPHRHDSLQATAFCVDQLKANVPVWKRELYAGDHAPVWKENPECASHQSPQKPPTPQKTTENITDKNMVQINVSNEELQQRIQHFIERKREQVNISNIVDFIPGYSESEMQDSDTCARVRTQFVRRSDSKSHLKIRKVYNEWGPQTVRGMGECGGNGELGDGDGEGGGLPEGVAERLRAAEQFVNVAPVGRDVYSRLKAVEERISHLLAVSPEYAHFWKVKRESVDVKQESMDYIFSADDIARKIELLEKQTAS